MDPSLLKQESAFKKATEEFRRNSGLSQTEFDELQATTILDLKRSITRIQNDQKLRRKMQHISRLEPFLNAMKQYGKVIEGPVKFLLTITSNMTEAFNALLDGYSTIGRSLPLFYEYQQLLKDNAYLQEILTYTFQEILEFHTEAVRFFKKPTWKNIFQATWRSFELKIKRFSEALNGYKKLIEERADIAHFEEQRKNHLEVRAKFRDLSESEMTRRRLEVLRWLGSGDHEDRCEEALKYRYSSTGTWLLNDNRFAAWFSPDNCLDPLLCLRGIPGSGKTVLGATVVEEVQKLTDASVAFHFCRHLDEHRNRFILVARSILSQLLIRDPDLLSFMFEEMGKTGTLFLSNEKLAKSLLEAAVGSRPKTYIVIDGLDEYSDGERENISTWFSSQVERLAEQDTGFVRCLFISQDDKIARKTLSDLSLIEIKPSDNQDDITKYCEHRQLEIERKHNIKLTGDENIAQIISARSQGMFLFAKLAMDYLLLLETHYDLLQEIKPERLPIGPRRLEQMYSRILTKLIPIDTKDTPVNGATLKLLGWLVCARRPLKWYEIQGAMMIDLDEGALDTRRKISGTCKDLGGSLVELKEDGSVTLVHLTAKKYLEQSSHLNLPHVESTLAMLSIAYLSWEFFDVERRELEIQKDLFEGKYAFADYAICFWSSHLDRSLPRLEVGSEYFDEMLEYLEVFINRRWRDSRGVHELPSRLKKNLDSIRHEEYYDKVCQAIAKHELDMRGSNDSSSSDEVLHLPESMRLIRKTLEGLATSTEQTEKNMSQLKENYGLKWFKCKRMSCRFFYEGFQDSKLREHHNSKHERPFRCAILDCHMGFIGCVTQKELETHMSSYHGINSATIKTVFPDLNKPSKPVKEPPQREGKFQCPECSKRYTRSFSLRVHARIHKNERPYGCGDCEKRFTRQHELKRHEKIHVRSEFVCNGTLKDGRSWGCKRSFPNAGGLVRHFNSNPGSVCLKPLFEEEAKEKSKWDKSENATSPCGGDGSYDQESRTSSAPAVSNYKRAFPISLYLQFPWLSDTAEKQVNREDGPEVLLKRSREAHGLYPTKKARSLLISSSNPPSEEGSDAVLHEES